MTSRQKQINFGLCSTPFGITDYCAKTQLLLMARLIGAQRLSASQKGHVGEVGYRVSICAQRLSASQIIAPHLVQVDAALPRYRGAQRLSASQIIALSEDASHRLARIQLIMCSTPFGITDYCAGYGGCERAAIGEYVCSTPFGITDYCAQYRNLTIADSERVGAQRLSASQIIAPFQSILQFSALLPVLNAFRHHRLLRAARARNRVHRGNECSTPFGITDYCAQHE